MDSLWIIFVFISCFFIEARCQFSDNTPPTMWLDRNWQISNTEAVDNVVTRVHAEDPEKDPLEFGLEPLMHGAGSAPDLPFRIDNNGVVYINESLQDKVGQNIFLYVTVSDGKLTAKNEVWVTIVNASSTSGYSSGTSNRLRPPFLQLPNFGNRHPPPISNNPARFPSFHPAFTHALLPSSSINPNKIHLEPVTDVPVSQNSIEVKSSTVEVISVSITTEASLNSLESNMTLLPADLPIQSAQDLTVALVPVLSVCAIFLAVGVIAVLFRKKIYLVRTKSSKEDMRKESNGGIVLQEDPSIAMQHWRGPRAFSNRYEPWERDSNLQQLGIRNLDVEDTIPIKSDQWEFPRHRLKVFNILGEGAFGQVWKCEAIDIDGKEGVSVVAVKTLKENASEKERSDLESELQVMKTLEPHPNVVRLLGCCTEKEPFFVIMEYVSKGKLQSFLRNSRAERYYGNMHGKSKSLTSRDLTSFVYQVARGMDYLSSKGIIHRDLAARNVLITDEHVCKVADFGFARDVVATLVYERKSEGRLPIRWMAPESLYDNIFSVKSDVWSFGVLIWEVVTLGSTPYPGLSAADVMRKVRDGHRLEKPEHCRRELYNIMYYCWDKEAKDRPTFTECVSLLEKLLTTETDYIELERFPDHSYYNLCSLSGEKL